MLENLKKEVCEANKKLSQLGLAPFTWGNVSGIDREKGLIAIKPSGVPYNELTPEKIVIVDLKGLKVEGDFFPSVDTITHCQLYLGFPKIGAVVHAHSHWATVFAQAEKPIIPCGTTHADFSFGAIPITKPLSKPQIKNDYEEFTGKAIVQCFNELTSSYEDIFAALARGHGPFVWGENCAEAVENTAILEFIADLAWHSEVLIGSEPAMLDSAMMEMHYYRKHGTTKTYGQGR